MDPRRCDICNTVFKPKNTRHRCCSPSCGAEAVRIKSRKRYSQHMKATHTPPVVKWDRRPLKDDYSHNQYLKEREIMERPNGWVCRDCGEALTGSQRLRCKECDAIMRHRLDLRIDGNNIYEGVTSKQDAIVSQP